MTTKPDAQDTNPQDTYTATELAAELGMDPKSFRSWLRTLTSDRAGRGGKWVFTAEDADTIRQLHANRGSKKATRPSFQPADAES